MKNSRVKKTYSHPFPFRTMWLQCSNASQVAQENPPAMQETRVQPLDREDPLKKETATHFSILAWRTPWTEEPGGYGPWGCKESDTTERLTHTQCG